jgi:hypothetical protein
MQYFLGVTSSTSPTAEHMRVHPCVKVDTTPYRLYIFRCSSTSTLTISSTPSIISKVTLATREATTRDKPRLWSVEEVLGVPVLREEGEALECGLGEGDEEGGTVLVDDGGNVMRQ